MDLVEKSIDNNWNLVTIVSSNDEYALYINDVEVDRIEKTFSIKTGPTTADAIIGAAHFSNSFYDRNFEGKIDELRIYNRAISSSEVSAIFAE